MTLIQCMSFGLFFCVLKSHILELEALYENQHTLIVNGKYFNRHRSMGAPQDMPTLKMEEFWITQRVDHFTPSDVRTFRQRYYINATFYKPGAPALILLGGEEPIDPKWSTVNEMMLQCQVLNCISYQVEHRFYGTSTVLEDASTKNLAYLTIQQALADFAHFIKFVRNQDAIKIHKVVLYGGSYSATLAAYMRQKYPKLIDIAIASSAPFDWKINYPEYNELVGHVLKITSQKCYDIVKNSMSHLWKLITESKSKLNYRDEYGSINSKLQPIRLCSKLDPRNELDTQLFFSNIRELFTFYVQYNDQQTFQVKDICNNLIQRESKSSTFEAFTETFNLMMQNANNTCIKVDNKEFCKYLSSTNYTSDAVSSGVRTWTWQTCTEVGAFQTTDSHNQPFGSHEPLQFSIQQCQCAFDKKITADTIQKGIDKTLSIYGGSKVPRSRTVFTNGERDPWSLMGLTHESQLDQELTDSEVILIKAASHCSDLFPPMPNESVWIRQARERTFNRIKMVL